MENLPEINCIERKFGYCIVDWEIENFGFAAHGMEYEIKSEPFSIRPHMTVWRIALKSELGLCDDTNIAFHLERMADTGPNAVSVSMNISLFDQDGKKWEVPNCDYLFRQYDSEVIHVPNIYFGRVNVALYNFYSMTIRCQMFVYEVGPSAKNDESVDHGLVGLSVDMQKLQKQSEFTDFKLSLKGCHSEWAVHKAILSVRSEILKDECNRNARETISYRSFAHKEDILPVLKYLYTGDVYSVIENPSVSLADCIIAFSLHELEEHYTADEIKLKSKIDIHQTGFMWKIENFSKSDYFLSDPINGDVVEMTWQLHLYPRGINGNDEYLAITAENIEGKIEGDVWAKVEVFKDSYDRSWKTMQVVKEGEMFELHDFESRNSVLEKLDNDTLIVCFKVCASTGKTHSSTVKVYPIPTFSVDYYYKKLSRDIFSLRADTRFADITVYADGKEFKAHKCILSVRSFKFHNLSDDMDEDKVLCIDDVRCDIVEIVLNYIYSGVFQRFDSDKLFEIYDAAWKMGVTTLITDCSTALGSNINGDNVFELLQAAYTRPDHALKDKSLKFLSMNVNICDKVLKKLESENPDLSIKVKLHLKHTKNILNSLIKKFVSSFGCSALELKSN